LAHADPFFHLTHGFDDRSSVEPYPSPWVSGRTWFDAAADRMSVFTLDEVGVILEYLELVPATRADLFSDGDREIALQAAVNFWLPREEVLLARSA